MSKIIARSFQVLAGSASIHKNALEKVRTVPTFILSQDYVEMSQ